MSDTPPTLVHSNQDGKQISHGRRNCDRNRDKDQNHTTVFKGCILELEQSVLMLIVSMKTLMLLT